jgi:hypothetical protein
MYGRVKVVGLSLDGGQAKAIQVLLLFKAAKAPARTTQVEDRIWLI